MSHKKPTKLKKLQGTYRKDRAVTDEVEFPALDSVPQPPKYFGEIARREWFDLLPLLQVAGTLERVDLPQLRQYCYNIQIIELTAEALEDEGYSSTLTNQGGFSYEVTNPKLKTMNDAIGITNRIASKFGFDPASRTRVAAPKKKEEEDPLAGAVKMKAS